MSEPVSIPGYRVEKAIASGASGTVYLARQEDLDRPVALKVLQPGLFDAKELRQRFLREAKLQARLSHPNILALYDAGFAGDRPYIVTELIEGGSLRDLLARGALPAKEAVRIGREIATALAAAHEARIVHRDLKPENVLLTPEGVCKVADFGLAKSQAAHETVQTKEGLILGTPGYLAPEVLEGREATASADVYALGVMLYELVEGRKPFEGKGVSETLQAQLGGSYEPLGPGVPSGLAELIHACIDRDERRRPGSMAQVRDRLLTIRATAPSRKVAAGRSAITSQVRIPAMTQEATRVTRLEETRSRSKALPAAIAGLVLLAAFAATRDPEPAPAPSQRPVLPRILRVTGGCDSVRVELAEAPSELVTATIQRTADGWTLSEPFPSGRVHSFKGLREASRYRISIAGASADAFTYPYYHGRLGPRLHDPAGPADDPLADAQTKHDDNHLQVIAAGSRVAAIWSCRRSMKSRALYFTQSFDSGSTWTGPERIHPLHPACDDARLSLSSSGVQVSWKEERGVVVRTLPDGAPQWTDPVVIPGSAGGTIRPVSRAGERTGGIFWTRKEKEYRFQWLGYDARSGLAPSWLALFEGEGLIEAGRSLLTPGGAFVFLEIDSPESDFIVWSASVKPEEGPWRPRQALTGEEEDIWDWDVAEYGGRVYIAYDFRPRIRVRRSEGLERFSEPMEPFGTKLRQATLGLAPASDGLYLICGSEAPDHWLTVSRSVDGGRWTTAGLPLTRIDHEPDILALARPDGRLVALEIEKDYGVGVYAW